MALNRSAVRTRYPPPLFSLLNRPSDVQNQAGGLVFGSKPQRVTGGISEERTVAGGDPAPRRGEALTARDRRSHRGSQRLLERLTEAVPVDGRRTRATPEDCKALCANQEGPDWVVQVPETGKIHTIQVRGRRQGRTACPRSASNAQSGTTASGVTLKGISTSSSAMTFTPIPLSSTRRTK